MAKVEKEVDFYSLSSTPFSEKEMYFSVDQDREAVDSNKRKKGGLITIPFILANEAFEKTASYGLQPNMILYLMKGYNMSFADGNRWLFLWSAALNFMPILGAFLADCYIGRFLTIIGGCLFSLLGTIVLWLTAMIPQAKPPSCALIQPCKQATASQYFMLASSLGIMSVGAGGIRSSSLAFGVDQVNDDENPSNQRVLESYFGWYYGATCFSILIALTAIVYIQDNFGMKVGFGIPAILMFLSGLMFFVAAPLYIKNGVNGSLFNGFGRVIVAAYKNRNLKDPPLELGWYHHEKGSTYTIPTEKLRCLNRACIIRSPEDDNAPLTCTVKQVEELKALIKVIPIWSTGIVISVNASQTAVSIIQANTMNRHLTSGFQIPAGSFSMFLILTVTIWVVLYDRAILPVASKIRRKPVRFSTKTRMGSGLFFSVVSMVVAGAVEHFRLNKAIHQNRPISAMWLVPQFVLLGLAEALNVIGQIEFYYSEFPKTMASISTSLLGVGSAVGNVAATVVLSAVAKYTDWVPSNVDEGRYDYYYWLLAAMGAVNVAYFVVCSWAYGACVEDSKMVDGNGGKDEEEEEVVG